MPQRFILKEKGSVIKLVVMVYILNRGIYYNLTCPFAIIKNLSLNYFITIRLFAVNNASVVFLLTLSDCEICDS